MANTKRKKKNNSAVPVLAAMAVFAVAVLIVVLLIQNKLDETVDGLTEKTEQLIPNGITYTIKYEEQVEKYSKEFDVDPVFVYSVIKVESNFDPYAKSYVGARGLMQIMEETYETLKYWQNDEESESFDDMYDPDTNIRYGTYYLSFLLDRYDGSMDLAAAAYHCGMGNVDSWLEEGIIDKDAFDVNDIPAENDQTSHYVNKINAAYSAYKEKLSDKDDGSSTVSSEE